MWKEGLANLSEASVRWTFRNLSLIGRKTVVNAYVVPKIGYLLQVLPLSKKQEEDITRASFGLLWRGKKRGKVRREVCYLPIEAGGIGLVDIEAMRKRIQVKWVARLISARREPKPWSRLASYWIENKGVGWGYSWIDHLMTTEDNNNYCPSFWTQAVRAWQEIE